ncbi:MAG: hypothetical protein KAG91_00955, partial [Mycoplasmataceae bacterium]|nr:hypothetical protein [Mycoplasmataceae bacterium]
GSKYQKAWKSLITVEFIKKLLLEGKTIDFEVSAISNISEVLAKHDEMKDASLSSRDLNDIYQTIDHFRGTWLTDYLKNIHTFNRTKLEKESKAIALFSSEYLKDPHEAVYDQVFKLADSQLSYQIITEEGNPTLKLLSSKDPDIKEFMSKPFMTLEKTAAFMKSIYQRGQAVDIAKLENHIKQVMFLKGRTGFNAMMLNAPDYVLHKLKMLQADITPLFPNNLDVTSWLNALNSEQARIDAIVSSSSKALPSDALVPHSATYTAAIGLKYGVNIVMNAAYDYTYTTTLTGISIVPHLSGDPLTEPSSSGPEIAMHLTRADNLKLKTEQTKLNGITSSGSQATPSDILIHVATPIDSAAVLKYGLLEKCTTYASATAAIAAATGISTSAFRWQTTQKPFDIYIDGVKKHFLKGARVMFNWSTGDKQFAIRTKASIDDNDAIWITSRSAGTGVLIKTIAFSKIPFGSQDFQYTYTTSAAGITVTAHLKSNPNAASLITPREIILHSTRTEILALNNEQTRINSLTSVNSWVSSADALVGAWTPLTTSIASKYGVTIVFDSKYDYKYKSTATGIKIMVHMKNHPQHFSSIVPALITLDHSRADVAEMVATQNKIN